MTIMESWGKVRYLKRDDRFDGKGHMAGTLGICIRGEKTELRMPLSGRSRLAGKTPPFCWGGNACLRWE